ncbi:MAG: class I SAM-dependent methyltransferase, partial [Solirubrobacteraceae bacterium]
APAGAGVMVDDGYTPQALRARTRAAIGARGVRPVAGDLARFAGRALAGYPWTLAGGGHGRFHFRGQSHPYLYRRHKRTWLTERAVEVPVIQAIVDRHADKRILEVGHVLGHYRPQSHLVIDKYEQAPGVLNRDVLALGDLGGAFDLIVAISTLEHVGHDEQPRDPDKARRAVAALRERLAPGGRLVLTVPVGYNPAFDAALRSGAIAVGETAALRRVGGATRWREVAPADVWSAPYDFLLYSARGVLFAFIERARG